jgi:hypothetical protein
MDSMSTEVTAKATSEKRKKKKTYSNRNDRYPEI